MTLPVSTKRRHLLQAATLAASTGVIPRWAAAEPLRELRVDYAYYSPVSVVLRRFGWLEETFRPDGTAVRWVLSAGSNRALEYLNSGSIDIGSTAGLAAVLGRANGNPIRAPYLFSRPEWTALVVRRDSSIRSLADLRGRRVAATKGTDPYLFLLRALQTVGLHRSDIQHVPLQHAEGRVALEQGQVDAWAGLDPLMAASELDAGSRLLYRNPAFNTFGFLNVREAFLAERGAEVRRVIKAYERARLWTRDNLHEATAILAEEAHVSPAVAAVQLQQRTDLSNPQPSQAEVSALRAASPILMEEQLVRPETDLGRTIGELVDTTFAQDVTGGKG